jgi:hypothetical protein
MKSIVINSLSGDSYEFAPVKMSCMPSDYPDVWMKFFGGMLPLGELSSAEADRLQVFMRKNKTEAVSDGLNTLTLAGDALAFCDPGVDGVSAPSSPGDMERGLKHGCASAEEVAALYAQRKALVLILGIKGVVTVKDVRKLDRLGRCDVANGLWSSCTQDAKDALLADPHHQVRSCATVANGK